MWEAGWKAHAEYEKGPLWDSLQRALDRADKAEAEVSRFGDHTKRESELEEEWEKAERERDTAQEALRRALPLIEAANDGEHWPANEQDAVESLIRAALSGEGETE